MRAAANPTFFPTIISIAVSFALLLPQFTVVKAPEQTPWPGEIGS